MQQDPPPESRPLDYRPAAADFEQGGDTSIFALRTFIAFVLSGSVAMGVVFCAIVIPLAGRQNPNWAVVVGSYIAAALGMGAAAVALRRRPRYRGYAAGIWLGLGAATLLQGLCALR